MKLNEKQLALLEFVKEMHGEQKRKYINTPYWEHPLAVAEIVDQYVKEEGAIEGALCHDLLEDVKGLTMAILHIRLNKIGYTEDLCAKITSLTYELTDRFTSENYPEFNREKRKNLEAQRLGNISPLAQSIKYADLIHNTQSIVQYDPDFAKSYLKEKLSAIDHMRKGDINLLVAVCCSLQKAEQDLMLNTIKQ